MSARASATERLRRDIAARVVHRPAQKAPRTRRAPRALESAQGMALMQWADLEARCNRPLLHFLRHIPNGGARSKGVAGKLKAEGVRRGTWDYVLPVVARFELHDDWQSTLESSIRYPGLWIELKIETERGKKNGGLTDEQVEFGRNLVAQGYAAVVAYSWEEARDAIISYLDCETVPHLFSGLKGVTCDTTRRPR